MSMVPDDFADINRSEIEILVHDWRTSNLAWIQDDSVPLHIIRYDDLKSNLAYELIRLLRFLQWPTSKRRIACVLQHSEGRHHRRQIHPPPPSLFTEAQRLFLNNSIVEVEAAILARQARERRREWLFYRLLPYWLAWWWETACCKPTAIVATSGNAGPMPLITETEYVPVRRHFHHRLHQKLSLGGGGGGGGGGRGFVNMTTFLFQWGEMASLLVNRSASFYLTSALPLAEAKVLLQYKDPGYIF